MGFCFFFEEMANARARESHFSRRKDSKNDENLCKGHGSQCEGGSQRPK